MRKVLLSTMTALLATVGSWAQTVETANLESGFYRIKYVGSAETDNGKYLTSPEELPTTETSEQDWKVALSSGTDASDMHRDVWYVENLGLADGNDFVRYKIWCFRGGYGLATNPSPDVYGSYGNTFCPRLYRIAKVVASDGSTTYAFSGHDHDNVNGQSMGMSSGAGAIGNKAYLSNTLNRGSGNSNAANDAVQWSFEPVDATTLKKTVTIGSTGFATFSCYAATIIPESVTAYEATEVNGTVKLAPLSFGIIPANTGVVLEGSAGEYDLIPTNGLGKGMKAVGSNDVVDANNKFSASVAGLELVAGDYILVKDAAGKAVFGRIGQNAEKHLVANKAYLPSAAVGESEAREFLSILCGGDMETAIENIGGAVATKDGAYIENNRVVILKNGVKYSTSGQIIK